MNNFEEYINSIDETKTEAPMLMNKVKEIAANAYDRGMTDSLLNYFNEEELHIMLMALKLYRVQQENDIQYKEDWLNDDRPTEAEKDIYKTIIKADQQQIEKIDKIREKLKNIKENKNEEV